MYRFERPPKASFIALLIVGILTIAGPVTSLAQEKKPAPSQDAAPAPAGPTNVRVVNTPSEPVPVVGTVSVSNLPAIQKISIDPSANTVKVDTSAPLTVRGEHTVLIFDQTRSVDFDSHVAFYDPVDVSQYKEIRIWAFVQGFVGYALGVQIVDPITGNAGILDPDMNAAGVGDVTKVYNPLCERIQLFLFGTNSQVRIRIYGRTN